MLGKCIYINLLKKVIYTFRTHLCDKLVGVIIWKILIIWELGLYIEILVLCEQVKFVKTSLTRADYDIFLVIYHRLELLGRHSEHS